MSIGRSKERERAAAATLIQQSYRTTAARQAALAPAGSRRLSVDAEPRFLQHEPSGRVLAVRGGEVVVQAPDRKREHQWVFQVHDGAAESSRLLAIRHECEAKAKLLRRQALLLKRMLANKEAEAAGSDWSSKMVGTQSAARPAASPARRAAG